MGKGPQNLGITSNNGWLLCANMPGQNVAVFRIDPKTWKIKPAGEPVAMPTSS
ncbi:MAG: beta-propeller fold lactonase family protein [Planctomycetota bacterium]|nr:beta-propeller fold lactonase family protein [Planctomycetota bacterium]